MFTWKKLLNFLKASYTWEIRFCGRSQNKVVDYLSKSFASLIPSTINEWYMKEKRSDAFKSIKSKENEEVKRCDFSIHPHEIELQIHQSSSRPSGVLEVLW